MYRQFYGLTRKPFEMSPDPYFYYPTIGHNEALALLTYGVLQKKGFVVVSGEVGTGKTLLVRCLLDALNHHKISFAFVYNPVLSVQEFLFHLLNEFGIATKPKSKVELLSTLNSYLLTRYRRGETTAIVIDEAQLLSWKLLEEIRLLTNLETSDFKLMQIVLVGQPELDQKLDSQGLRQLKQRVAMRCRLKALEFEEVRGYIQRRLGVAGANAQAMTIFPDETIQAIHQFSRGIPRLINSICENALIAGYSNQVQQITLQIVEEVAGDLCLEPSMPLAKSDGPEATWELLAEMMKPWGNSDPAPSTNPKSETAAQAG
jgi:general secretion pathway protein A